jgi:hypothetical protein
VKIKVSTLQKTFISSPDFQKEVKMEPKSLNITPAVFNVSMLESEGPLRGPTSNRLLLLRRTPLRVDCRSYSGLPLCCSIFDMDRFYKKKVSDLIALVHRNEWRIEELIRFFVLFQRPCVYHPSQGCRGTE